MSRPLTPYPLLCSDNGTGLITDSSTSSMVDPDLLAAMTTYCTSYVRLYNSVHPGKPLPPIRPLNTLKPDLRNKFINVYGHGPRPVSEATKHLKMGHHIMDERMYPLERTSWQPGTRFSLRRQKPICPTVSLEEFERFYNWGKQMAEVNAARQKINNQKKEKNRKGKKAWKGKEAALAQPPIRDQTGPLALLGAQGRSLDTISGTAPHIPILPRGAVPGVFVPDLARPSPVFGGSKAHVSRNSTVPAFEDLHGRSFAGPSRVGNTAPADRLTLAPAFSDHPAHRFIGPTVPVFDGPNGPVYAGPPNGTFEAPTHQVHVGLSGAVYDVLPAPVNPAFAGPVQGGFQAPFATQGPLQHDFQAPFATPGPVQNSFQAPLAAPGPVHGGFQFATPGHGYTVMPDPYPAGWTQVPAVSANSEYLPKRIWM